MRQRLVRVKYFSTIQTGRERTGCEAGPGESGGIQADQLGEYLR